MQIGNLKRVVIVEDEKPGRNLLKSYLTDYPDFHIVGEAENGIDGVKVINETKPDIVFLDIQMPGKTGIQMLPHLEVMPHIVFTTAYDKFAMQAFEVHAIDFLLKPYTRERFAKAMSKLQAWINTEKLNAFIQNQVIAQVATAKRILVQSGKSSITINIEDIIYLEAFGDYTKVLTTSGTYLSSLGITKLEEKLSQGFVKIHRSNCISLAKTTSLIKEDGIYIALMSNGDKLKISRSYQHVVNDHFLS
jgi:two-component system, LytTR family, response regulator